MGASENGGAVPADASPSRKRKSSAPPRRQRAKFASLFLPRRPQIFPGRYELAFELGPYPLEQRAGRIAHLLLQGGVGIEIGVACGVRFPVSDVPVEYCRRPRRKALNEAKPVSNAHPALLGPL